MKPEVVEEVTIISKGVAIDGKIISNGNMRLDGKIKGDLIISGDLTCGDSSEIVGTVKAENLALNGKVEGIITAKNKLILKSKANVQGDIFAKILVIEEGAKFEGKSQMSNYNFDVPKSTNIQNDINAKK